MEESATDRVRLKLMLNMFLAIFARGLAAAAAVTFLGGSLNVLLGWNLSLSIGGSATALPRDPVSVAVVSAILAGLAALSHFFSDPRGCLAWLRANPKKSAAVCLVGLTTLAIGLFQISGGGLGSALRSGDAEKIRKYLEKHPVEPEILRKHLYQELKNGRLESSRAVLDCFQSLNQTAGEHKTTLLADGVVFFPKEAVLLLLEKGADPTIPDQFGRSPALRLVLYRLPNFPSEGEGGMVELLQALGKAGCDLKQPAEDGETPLKAAQARALKEVENCLPR